MNVMTIGGMSRPCCGDVMVTVSTEEGSSAKNQRSGGMR